MRFLAVFLMVFMHLPGKERLWFVDNALLKHSSEFWYEGLSRASAPLLGFLSAFFIFHALHREDFPSVLSRRLRSLYVPALLWSVLAIVPVVLLPELDVLKILAMLRQQNPLVEPTDFANFAWRALGLSGWPLLNEPVHYLFDLFMCVLVFGIAHHLRPNGRLWFLGVAVALFGVSLLFGKGRFPHGANYGNIVPRLDLVLFFSIGYLTQVFGSFGPLIARIRGLRWPAIAAIFAVLVITSQYRVALDIFDPTEKALAFVVITFNRVLSSILLAKAIMVLSPAWKSRAPSDRLSFSVFVTHRLVFLVVTLEAERLLGIGIGGQPSLGQMLGIWAACVLVAYATAFGLHKLPRAATELLVPSR